MLNYNSFCLREKWNILMKMESCTTVLKDLKLLTVVAKNFILDVCGRHGYPNFQSMLPTMLSLPLEIKLI